MIKYDKKDELWKLLCEATKYDFLPTATKIDIHEFYLTLVDYIDELKRGGQ